MQWLVLALMVGRALSVGRPIYNLYSHLTKRLYSVLLNPISESIHYPAKTSCVEPLPGRERIILLLITFITRVDIVGQFLRPFYIRY